MTPWAASPCYPSTPVLPGTAIVLSGSDGTLEAALVRDTLPNATGVGQGFAVQDQPDVTGRGHGTTLDCIIERSHGVGVLVSGADLLMQHTAVRDILPAADGSLGRGVSIQAHLETAERAHLSLEGSLVQSSSEVGLFVFGSNVEIADTVLRSTAPEPDGTFGDGLVALSTLEMPAVVHLATSTLAEHGRAGIASFGATITMSGNVFQCNPVHLNGEQNYPFLGTQLSLPAVFDDAGGNTCGCAGQTSTCAGVSTGLGPPTPLADPAIP